jgi:prevent-host-death family protein
MTTQSPSLTNLTKPASLYTVVVMSTMLNLYAAKTHLSTLVDEAAAGAEIVIAKAGKPMAKLVPYRPAAQRTPGSAASKIWISPDFDAPLPRALADAFAGRSE